MKILLSGATGLIGSALKQALELDGHEVDALKRPYGNSIDMRIVDAVVHLAGENIANGRWTPGKKKAIEESRVNGTRQLAMQIGESDCRPAVFISASAIGYYGDRGNEPLDESSSVGTGFLPEVCSKWEKAAHPAEEAGVRTVQIRTGIVLSSRGGALRKMLRPFMLGAGGIMGNGRQHMSWISMEDMVSAIRFIIENETIRGPVNLVSPNPVDNKEFTKTLGKVLRRPTILPLPAFAARIILGEMADALLLASSKVLPKKLLDAGFQFKHPFLGPALENILNEKK